MLSLFQREPEAPLTIIDRTVSSNSSKSSPTPAPKQPPQLHQWSSARAVAAQAVFVRPGEYRVVIPSGWMGSIEDVHTELALRTTEYALTGQWPSPPKPAAKPEPAPEPTPEEREQNWIKRQIAGLALTKWTWPRLANRS